MTLYPTRQLPLLGFIDSHPPLFVTPQASAAPPSPTAQTTLNPLIILLLPHFLHPTPLQRCRHTTTDLIITSLRRLRHIPPRRRIIITVADLGERLGSQLPRTPIGHSVELEA